MDPHPEFFSPKNTSFVWGRVFCVSSSFGLGDSKKKQKSRVLVSYIYIEPLKNGILEYLEDFFMV